MSFKFLIDECLTPRLRQIALNVGNYETTSVRDLGLTGTLDHNLMKVVIDQDFTLVTRNSVDFRGDGPGNLGGLHSKVELHAGLVCLNGVGLDLDTQRALFAAALEIIEQLNLPLINQALELFLEEDGTLEYSVYEIPLGTEPVNTHNGTWNLQPFLYQVAAGTL